MKNISRYKINSSLIICIFIFFVISMLSIYSAQSILPDYLGNLIFKQLFWYIIGGIIVFLIMTLGNDFIYRHSWFLYILGVFFLILLLFIGKPINNAKCWFDIPGIGTIQPSEFMKIILIITLGVEIDKFNNKFTDPTVKQEFNFLLKVLAIVFIPSILTFLQPDTGVVLIYLLIAFVMVFIAGIRYRWFIVAFSVIAVVIAFILITYFANNDLFIKLFGTSFFLRVDRLLDWSNQDGFQLSNGLNAIGSAGLLGNGFNNTPIYFPEAQTDFIFAVYASNFGFIGSLFLISTILFFDIKLINIAIKNNNNIHKYIISGIIGMLIYQQIQNIGMTIGIMPITGITLPFISYGGSSLLSYMIMLGIIFNISNQSLRYTN